MSDWITESAVRTKPQNTLLRLFEQERESIRENQSQLPSHMMASSGKKNSEILYEEIYRDVVEQNTKRLDVCPLQENTLLTQNSKCWQCQKSISMGFLGIGSNCEQCSYNGRYFCADCLSPIRMPIPWKGVQEFDLRHYKVSKLAQQEINKLYEVPLLDLEYASALVKSNKSLFEFMVLKRTMHLMYDTICQTSLMQTLFMKRMNLCLKRNLFSLKDLYEIYNGSLLRVLQAWYNLLIQHINFCKSCQTKGQQCLICQSEIYVYAFDLKNVTYCEKCNHLYHRSCLDQKSCPKCLENN